jgi:hypothetical protein
VLLRIAAAAPLLLATFPLFSDACGAAGAPFRLIGIASGVFLLLGFGTPIAAGLQVLIEGWLAFAGGTLNPNHGALALMGLALLMLGPGQYSVDQRLYGRQRIELRR